MESRIRVLIVDDENLFRHALRALLGADPRIEVVGEASNGAEAVEICDRIDPDVVLMDIKMPVLGGLEATKTILRTEPGIRVIALTTFTTESRVIEMLRVGACGYLTKTTTPEELVDAIVAAEAGDRVLSSEVQTAVVRELLATGARSRWNGPRLSEREQQVIELVAQGLSNTQIAEQLHLSESTVKGNIGQINVKLDASNRLQIVLHAVAWGLVEL